VDISYGGATTAAAEAQGLDEAGKTVSFDSYSRETLSSTVLQATEDIRTSAMWQYMSEMARW
jgi:hypothetical protein